MWNMEIAALKAFLAVSAEASFSRAAQRLFITQPAVSKRIASLEAELGVKLFDREGRKIRLTEAGLTLLPHAREIVHHADHTRELLSALSGHIGGVLKMASSHHIGLHRLPAILKRYARRYPQVELDLRFLDSETASRQVEAGDLELALVTLPERLPATLTMEVIWHDPLRVVTAHDCRQDLETLLQTRAILPPRNTWTRQIIEHRFEEAGIEIRTLIETNNLETIRKMVEIGLGWSILPATMLSPSLRAMPADTLELHRRLGIIHHHKRSIGNAAAAMIELLKRKKGAEAPSIQQLNNDQK